MLTRPAHAGHWQFSASGSSETTTAHAAHYTPPTPTPWSPPVSPSDNSLSLSFPSGSVADASTTTTPTCDLNESASVYITAHWVSDTNSDNTPPTSVWFEESATASWSGSGSRYATFSGDNAANGLSDPYVVTSLSGLTAGGSSVTSTAATTPPDDWQKFTVSGTTVTLPVRNLVAQASGSGRPIGISGGVTISTTLSYSISVHAQPYDWHIKQAIANWAYQTGAVNGSLYFMYDWDSTSGSVNDLGSCYWHERVTYDGPNPFTPPLPFVNTPGAGPYDNPTITPGLGANGGNMATTYCNDTHKVWTSAPPYFSSPPVSASQRYEFDDLDTGESNVLVPGPDSTATIVRTIEQRPIPYTGWWYSCTKAGITGWVQLQ